MSDSLARMIWRTIHRNPKPVVDALGPIPWAPCAACLLPREECVCPVFQEQRLPAMPFEAKIDHARPNPFK